MKDTLAVHAALLHDRTPSRQQPTFKDDDRQYAAITQRSFQHADTVITAHVENNRIRGNAPRNVPLMAYIGPPQVHAFTDPGFT